MAVSSRVPPRLQFRPTESGRELLHTVGDAEINWLSAEQSNSSPTIGDIALLKIFRRMSSGQHPEAEMGRCLTAAGFAYAPALLAEIRCLTSSSPANRNA